MRLLLFILFSFPILLVGQGQMTDSDLKKKGIDLKKHVPKGLKVGDKAPEISGFTVNGDQFNSDSILKEKQLVVIFYRGKWCPYCNRHLSNLNDSLKYILDEGAEVLVVGPETFENAEKTTDKNEADFTLLPDTSLNVMQAYDVLFSVTKKYQGKIKTFLFTSIAENNAQEEAQLPVPATYVIGKDGKIKWRHFDYDYTTRSTVAEILKALN